MKTYVIDVKCFAAVTVTAKSEREAIKKATDAVNGAECRAPGVSFSLSEDGSAEVLDVEDDPVFAADEWLNGTPEVRAALDALGERSRSVPTPRGYGVGFDVEPETGDDDCR